jgi:hypothetical protein
MNKPELKKVWYFNEKMNNYLPILFTSKQKKIIAEYCKSENIKMSEMIRQAIFEYLRRKLKNE